MPWGSVSEFLAMGGYGFYVWTAFGATAFCMVCEVLVLYRKRMTVVAPVREKDEIIS